MLHDLFDLAIAISLLCLWVRVIMLSREISRFKGMSLSLLTLIRMLSEIVDNHEDYLMALKGKKEEESKDVESSGDSSDNDGVCTGGDS